MFIHRAGWSAGEGEIPVRPEQSEGRTRLVPFATANGTANSR